MKVNMGTDEAIKRWDSFAREYASNHEEQGDTHKEIFLNPTLFSLMGDLKNKQVLDAGCGEGYLSRLMAKAGAKVTAVDYSEKMLEIANKRTSVDLQITYSKENIEDLSSFSDESFDVIVSNMVIQDLKHFDKVFKEMNRLLVSGGQFVFSILHPCFVTPGSGWVKTDDGKKLYWKVDNYFYEGVYEQSLGGEQKMLLFHRTLSTYINTLLATGFNLKQVIEPKPPEEMLQKHPSYQEDFKCADFIVFQMTT